MLSVVSLALRTQHRNRYYQLACIAALGRLQILQNFSRSLAELGQSVELYSRFRLWQFRIAPVQTMSGNVTCNNSAQQFIHGVIRICTNSVITQNNSKILTDEDAKHQTWTGSEDGLIRCASRAVRQRCTCLE